MFDHTFVLVSIGTHKSIFGFEDPDAAEREVERFNAYVADHTTLTASAEILDAEESTGGELTDLLPTSEPHVVMLEKLGWTYFAGDWSHPAHDNLPYSLSQALDMADVPTGLTRSFVRILETFHIQSLRGKVAALERRNYDVVQFTFGATSMGRSGYVAEHKDVEVFDRLDTSKVRIGDRVRIGITGQIVEIARVCEDGTFRFKTSSGTVAENSVLHGAYFNLVTSDTPLE